MSQTKLDVVLINPGGRAQIYQALGADLAAIEPPVWAGLMATFLRRKGSTVSLIDAEAEELTPEDVAERVAEIRPVLAAVVVYGHQPSASTQNMTAAGALCAALRRERPDLKTMLVGGHVAALPERTLREEAVDFVAGGEGPITLAELVEALKTARPDFSKVRGLWYREDGALRSTAPAPLVRNLDAEMPELAWDLLPMEKYRAHNWHALDGLQRQPYASIYTTLGCPYHCSFCLRDGTTIITVHGRNKKIEEITIGDKVLAWDEQAKRLSESTVIATGNRWVDRVLKIRMNTGETIEVTHEHPIYTPQGWVDAGKLRVGQQILVMESHDEVACEQVQTAWQGGVTGEAVVPSLEAYEQEKIVLVESCPRFVEIESIEEVRGQFQVFNFQCSPHDNYFAERLLVHNCCIQAPFKSGEKQLGLKESTNSYRFWSVESVMAQIDRLVREYGVRNIKIADEMFVLHPKHVLGICEAIIERGYDLNIWAYARVDTVREDMVDRLKQAGFNWLAFGIEAANARVRDDVQKGFGQEDIFRTINRVRSAGINVIGNYIFGLPEDDLATMQETLDLALELNCEFANFYAAQAYPGSALYVQAVREGWPLPERWSGYSQHAVDTLPLPTKHISGAEVLRFRDHAFQTYFTHTSYLEMIERRFGPKTVAHIKEMASHKLVRQSA